MGERLQQKIRGAGLYGLHGHQALLEQRGFELDHVFAGRQELLPARRKEANVVGLEVIVVVPSAQTTYYTNMSEELFIEKDINWLRLRDVTLRYTLPEGRFLHARHASVFMTVTDLFLLTNYSGMDPIVNGNTAAVGGSGAVGIDFGNFPMPRGFNFGMRIGF